MPVAIQAGSLRLHLFKDEDILAVFIGNLMELDETERAQHSDYLARLELPVTSLNPVCFTLKKFRVFSTAKISDATACFVLRHVPLLEELYIWDSSTVDALKLLYELEQQDLDNAAGTILLFFIIISVYLHFLY